MVNEKSFKDAVVVVLILGLFILGILVLKPIAFSIVWGVLLAYIFYPLYKRTLKKVKSENLSAVLILILLILIILVPLILVLNLLIGQAIKFYLLFQNMNLVEIINQTLPSFITSSEIIQKLSESLAALIPNLLASFINISSEFVINLPVIILQILVVIFVFLLSLKDGEKIIGYVRDVSPFTKETANKFSRQFKNITSSVLYGQIVAGIIQGLVAGVGYLVLGIDYPLLLTILTIFFAIIPFIGAGIVWFPVDIYLFSVGKTWQGIALLVYGLVIISLIDNVFRTVIVSRKTKINSAIVMTGMIGGLFVFGILGLMIGPLVLSYVILVVEIYKEKKTEESVFFKDVEPGKKG